MPAPKDGQFDKYEVKPGASEPWYKDSEFITCPTCDHPGKFAKNVHGKLQFLHRVNKPNGMFGFEEGHKE